MNQERIREILAKIENVTVAVYGDFCVDAYWMLDPKGRRSPKRPGCTPGRWPGITTRSAARPMSSRTSRH